MILGYHVVLSAYGFWLPNDPRGSWSRFVGSARLLPHGRATKVETHASVAGRPHDGRARLAAKSALLRPPVRFTGLQARAVARGFAALVREAGPTVWACAILPEHTHLVLAAHRYAVDQVANLLKGAATRWLLQEGRHPFHDRPLRAGRVPSPWARGVWKVFLHTPDDVRRAIRYVQDNPAREGLAPQRWSFVRPYDGAEAT